MGTTSDRCKYFLLQDDVLVYLGIVFPPPSVDFLLSFFLENGGIPLKLQKCSHDAVIVAAWPITDLR